MDNPDHIIRDVASLRALYGEPAGAAVTKQVDHLHPHYQALIKASPFCVLATVGETVEITPRGDAPGFVEIADAHTLLLPDRRGNNRIDNLRNIVEDPRVTLLFLIPGVGETLRVVGTAQISVDPALLARFVVNNQLPKSVLVVKVQYCFFQCAKALMRSRLWEASAQIERTALPSNGRILEDITKGEFDGAAYDKIAPQRLKDTMY
jgi:PPOX class probable FMN-dependent enzyme